MFKTRIAVCLMIILLLLVIAPSLTSVEATVGRCNGGRPAINIYASRWNQTSDDVLYSQWACQDIYYLFYNMAEWEFAGYYWDEELQTWMPIYNYVWTYGHVCNYYGDGTTQSNVLSEAEHCEEYHDFTAVFDYGHGSGKNESDPNTLHYGIYPDAPPEQSNPPNLIMDWETYPYTNDNHHFEFLWACGSGNKIGGFDSYSYPAGLPFGWTHKGNGSLSTNGYTDPWSSGGSYCFIGFENYSKPISDWITLYTNRYKHFIVFFYYFMLIHNEVREALDSAWYAVTNYAQSRFDQSSLYNGYNYTHVDGSTWWSKAHIYGDGNLQMP